MDLAHYFRISMMRGREGNKAPFDATKTYRAPKGQPKEENFILVFGSTYPKSFKRRKNSFTI
jgi:hypothetical protein